MSVFDSAGFVSLVGAGPGDPGLITVRGRERLSRADVVVYDRLASKALLAVVPPQAECVDVGKTSSAHTVPQDQIGQLLVDRARQGKYVVRLKGGDPFVFGRGGEEAGELVDAGIDFEIVPGVTSALAVPAYAGIPVTQRSVASSFAVIAGHEDGAKTESSIDWARVAHGADTLIFLMGRRAMPDIVARLVVEGRDGATPAAAIEWGTTPAQRTVTATLDTLLEQAETANLQAPVVIVVGDVVKLRDRLQWFDRRPLFGKRVLVTRTRQQASALVRRLVDEGAEALELPAIEVVEAEAAPIRRACQRLALKQYDWAIFTSANGVREFFRYLHEARLDSRAFGASRIAVIGSETANALERHGLRADLIPPTFVAEALLDVLSPEVQEGSRVLLARAAEARDVLPRELRARGASVDEVVLYTTRRPPAPDAEIIRRIEAEEVDVATFTASSTVRGCIDLLDGRVELLDNVLVACIGPVTAQTATDAGLRVGLVSQKHTIAGLVGALRDHYGKVAAHA